MCQIVGINEHYQILTSIFWLTLFSQIKIQYYPNVLACLVNVNFLGVYIYVCYVYECVLFWIDRQCGDIECQNFYYDVFVTLFTCCDKRLFKDIGRFICV
jgi:hypothetical protein